MTARIDHLVTSGTFSLDGGTWDVDNNVWIVGDDDEVDRHRRRARRRRRSSKPSAAGRCAAIVCTHAHNDHIDAAPALAARTGAPILLHPADLPLWKMTHPDTRAGRASWRTARC